MNDIMRLEDPERRAAHHPGRTCTPAWPACSGSPTRTCCVVVASLLLLTGSMADRLGRKRLFLVGLSGFSLGSLLC